MPWERGCIIVRFSLIKALLFINFLFYCSTPRKARQYSTASNSDTSSYDTPQLQKKEPPLISPRVKKLSVGKSSQERLITSRSASDLPSANRSPQSHNQKQPTKVLSPSTSVDQEWGDLEKEITDTRRSIDAKFYRSLANSHSPFFRPSKATGLMTPGEHDTDENVEDDEESHINGHDINQPGTSTQRDNSDIKTCSTRTIASIYMRRTSDIHYPIVNEKAGMKRDNAIVISKSEPKSPTVSNERPSYPDTGFNEQRRKSHSDSMVDAMKRRSNRGSLEAAFENRRELPVDDVSSGYAIVDTPKVKSDLVQNPPKPPRHVLRSTEPVMLQINAKSGSFSLKSSKENIESVSRDSGSEGPQSVSDSSIYDDLSKSQDTLTSDKDSLKYSLVKTKVREATEIINERKLRDSPEMSRRESYKISSSDRASSPPKMGGQSDHSQSLSDASKKHFFRTDSDKSFDVPRSPKLNDRTHALVKAVDAAAKQKLINRSSHLPSDVAVVKKSQPMSVPNKTHTDHVKSKLNANSSILGKSPDNLGQLDESLSETFAKIDAAFGFKASPAEVPPPPSRDEKRKKKRSYKRRSRNFEPPSSDSSEDIDPDRKRRANRNVKRISPENPLLNSLPKSEAEESLEAAITEFHMSLSAMPVKEKTNSKELPADVSSSKGNIKERSNVQPGLPFQKISSHAHQTTRGGEENPPKVPIRTSRPQSLMEHRRLVHLHSAGNPSSKPQGHVDITAARRKSEGFNLFLNKENKSKIVFQPMDFFPSFEIST